MLRAQGFGFRKTRGVKDMTRREIALWVMKQLYGTFYKWGGDDPSGYDCSGAVIEALQSAGAFPRDLDMTARGLHTFFFKADLREIQPGDLVFWGPDNQGVHIRHIEMVFNLDPLLSIGASGGDSQTQTEGDAITDNAYVKIRKIEPRGSLSNLFYCRVPYEEIA